MTKESSSTFFSYSRQDSEFALRLGKDLKASGASVWLDQLDITAGQRWDRAVQEALSNCPRVLIVLSPSSVDSDNVMDEVSYALEKRKIVIPVLYRNCEIPFRLRRLQYIDFRAQYEGGLEELSAILATQEATPGATPILGREELEGSYPAAAPQAKGREEAERQAREAEEARLRAEVERKAREAEQLARERAEVDRAAKAKAEQDRLAREQAERDKIEADRLAKAEAERAAKAQAEQDRLARKEAGSFAQRLIGVFLSPREAFADIARKPDFLAPLALYILATVAFSEAILAKIGVERIIRTQIVTSGGAGSMSPDQIDRRVSQGAKTAAIFYHISFLETLIVLLIIAVIGLGIVRIVFGVKTRFATAFSITCYANLPGVLGMLLGTVLVLFGNPEHFNLAAPFPATLAFFLDQAHTSKALFALATSVDLFTFWLMGLLSIGFSAATEGRARPRRVFFAFLAAWAVYVLIKMGAAA